MVLNQETGGQYYYNHRNVLKVEVCKPVGSRWVHSRRARVIYFFYRSGSGSFSFSPFIVPCMRRAHMATVWNTDYIINITHRLCNMQGIFARISIQVTVDHAEHQGEVGAWLLKVPNASGKAAFWIIHAFDDDPDCSLLIGCAFREKCIFRDFIMKAFLFSIQIISF